MRDVDIRHALRAAIEREHSGDPETRIVDELGLRQGRVRVDVTVVNGSMHGYEIKSYVDTLRRLPNQVEVYSEILDQATIVLADRHRSVAEAAVPDWWGIVVAGQVAPGEPMSLSVEREPQRNPGVNKRALAELLWRDEALEMLRARNADRGVRTKSRAYVWDRLCEVFACAEIAAAVRARLKDRATQTAGQ